MGQDVSRRERKEIMQEFSLNQDEMKTWLRAFRRNSDALLKDRMNFRGFKRAFQGTDATDDELRFLFEQFDDDGNGCISFHEFVFAVLVNGNVSTKYKLKAAFDIIDENGNGSIEEEELQHLASRAAAAHSKLTNRSVNVSSAEVRQTFRRMDVDGNKHISLEEFLEQIDEHGGWIKKLFNI